MEKKLELSAAEGHVIHGVLNTTDESNDVLVVFVHGLTGDLREHLYHSAAATFPQEGVDTFRFALYTDERKGRKLSECTIAIHAGDLNTVLSYFQESYRSIAVVGHSLGSPTILKANTEDVSCVVLWEPSYLSEGRGNIPFRRVQINGKEMGIIDWGIEFLLNPAMMEEWQWFNAENELSLVENLGKPLKIIAGGDGVLLEGSRKYCEVAHEPKELSVIPGATHCFDEEGKSDMVLEETLSWIKQHAHS